MATAMPIRNQRNTEATRVVVFVEIEMSYLLSLVAQYKGITKKSLHKDIWEAGIRSYLGIDPTDVANSRPAPLARSTTPPADMLKLVLAILGNAPA